MCELIVVCEFMLCVSLCCVRAYVVCELIVVCEIMLC